MSAGTYFADVIESIANGALQSLEGLSTDQLNQHLSLPETNTLFAIAAHLIGATEFWTVHAAMGKPVVRDRDAEFTANGSLDDLKARYGEALPRIRAAISDLDGDDLTNPCAGERRVAWRSDPQTMTIADCLLHAVEHAALHQGHIQMTRQMLLEPPF